MKLRIGLFVAWLIPNIFMSVLNISVLIFLILYNSDLLTINRFGIWFLFWILHAAVISYGWYKIISWYRKGEFHTKSDLTSPDEIDVH